MSKESRLLKNTAILAVGNICTKCVSFFLLPLYTAKLSTGEFGSVDIVTTYTSLFTIILTLQMELAVFRFLVEARDNPDEQKNYITTTLVVVLVALSIFLPLCAAVLIKIRYAFTIYFLINTAGSVLNTVVLQLPRGLGDNTTYAAGSCISGSLNICLNVLFVAILDLGVEGMLTSCILSTAICCIFVACRIKLVRYLKRKGFCKKNAKKMLAYALPLVPYTMSWWIIDSSDRTIISAYIGVAANGIYAVANKFSSVFNMVSNIFQTAWMESACENVNEEDRNQYYSETINTAVKFYSSCNIGIIAALPFFLTFLVDASYAEVYYYIPILLTAAMFHAVSAMYGALFFAFKKTKEAAFSAVLSAVINIGINLLLIPQIGLYAPAISTLAAYMTIAIQRYFKMKKQCGIILDPKYLITELIVYVAVGLAYYCGNRIFQAISLLLVIPYCLFANRAFLSKSVGKIKNIYQNRRLG